MSRNDAILGAAALLLVVFSLVVSLVIPRRDPGFPGRNLKAFVAVAAVLVVAMLAAVEIFGEAHAEEGEEAAQVETGGAETGGAETGPAEPGGGDAAAGEEVYASAGCGSCHTLQEAGSTGTIGPNLDESGVDVQAAVQQIANGGGGMPAFSGQLTEEQIADVAAFVVASQG